MFNKKVSAKLYMRDREIAKNLLVGSFGLAAFSSASNLYLQVTTKKLIKDLGYELAKTESKVNAVLIETNSLSTGFSKYKSQIRKALESGDASKLSKKQVKSIERMLSGR